MSLEETSQNNKNEQINKKFDSFHIDININKLNGSWTKEEDKILFKWVQEYGTKKWTSCSFFLKGRTGKQIRDRWCNVLSPNLKKGDWDLAEDYIIFKAYMKFGSKWKLISKHLKSRSENSVKNRFYATLRRHALESVKDYEIKSEMLMKMKKIFLMNFLEKALNEKTLIIDSYINQNTEAYDIDELDIVYIRNFIRKYSIEEKVMLINQECKQINNNHLGKKRNTLQDDEIVKKIKNSWKNSKSSKKIFSIYSPCGAMINIYQT